MPEDWLELSALALPLKPVDPEQAWEVWPWSVAAVEVMEVGSSVVAEFAVVRADEAAASGTATSSAVAARRSTGVRMRATLPPPPDDSALSDSHECCDDA